MSHHQGTGEARGSRAQDGRTPRRRGLSGRSIQIFGIATTLLLPYVAGAQPAHAATEVVFASTGADQTWTVPAGVTSLDIAMIGGGGGGGREGNGGGGGAVSGVLSVTPGDTLTIIVGQGGITNTTDDATFLNPRNSNFRYGGGASGAGEARSFDKGWGSGAGRSAIRSSAALYGTTVSGEILTAAGGGGGGYGADTGPANADGGAGGGPTGGAGGKGNQCVDSGGGTQSAGGAGGGTLPDPTDPNKFICIGNFNEPGANGLQFAGGYAQIPSGGNNSEGGGGGGGYFGGGGGGNNGGGGGGSSFIGSSSYFTGTTSAGSGQTPGIASWPAACGVAPGLGSAKTSGTGPGAGGNGCVVITYTVTPPAPPAPPAPPTWTLSYDANGGTCTAPSQSGVNGTVVSTYGASACTRPGFTFTGWNTRSDGSGDAFAPGAATQLTGDGTLFAQWTPIQVSATDDSFITGEGTPVDGDLNANDTVPAGSQYSGTSNPSNGTVEVNADGTFTYTPQAGFSGTDSFTYEVCATGGVPCASRTVTITVTPRPIPPVVTPPNAPVTGTVVIPGVTPPTTVFTVVTPPAHGVVDLQPGGQYTYTPEPDFVGTDSFIYQACSSAGASCQVGTVRIFVGTGSPVDAKPQVKSSSAASRAPISFKPQTSLSGEIQIAREKSNSWVNRIEIPRKGTWVVTNNRVTFTPRPNFYGRVSIQYRVVAADGSVATSTFTAVRIAMPGVIDGGL
jgi:uncharacterized repeat protein (TIGR02543 family)